MSATTAPAEPALGTITSEAAFSSLCRQWDDLFRSHERPSPFLLRAWLTEWWRHYGENGELAVHVAYREGRLVGALPLCVRPDGGPRVLSFLGGEPAIADLLLAEGEGKRTADASILPGANRTE